MRPRSTLARHTGKRLVRGCSRRRDNVEKESLKAQLISSHGKGSTATRAALALLAAVVLVVMEPTRLS